MKIIEWPQFLEESLPFGGKESAVTVGVFDGVHLGHQILIKRIVTRGGGAVPSTRPTAEVSRVPVVITFRQGQYKKNRYSNPISHSGDILSFRQKMDIFEGMGVEVAIIVEFSESFRRQRGLDFFQILLDHGKMNYLTMGSDFRCGYQLDTDAPMIQKFTTARGVPTEIVEPLLLRDRLISSSNIRSDIALGNLQEASEMLGRPFTLDLGGAEISRSNNSICFDLNGLGRILPPPGRYQVLLVGKGAGKEGNGEESTGDIKKPAEIIIENGGTIICKDSGEESLSWEYAEFL